MQALSDTRKNYTLCDMFAFGLMLKWLVIGDAAHVPFAGLPAHEILFELRSLANSGGSMVHPYVADLSRVPRVFHKLIQARAPTLAATPFCPQNCFIA